MADHSSGVNEDFTERGKIADIGRWYVTRFVKGAAASLSPGMSILDAGAGECAYRKFFPHCRYRSVDLAVGETAWNYGNLDYVASLHALPLADNSFDAVLCTQVLEHLALPRESVAELYRVLKPEGRLFLTAPMSHGEHQTPYDYFRFTSFGLRRLCEDAGFTEVEVEPFGGIFTRWAYELPGAMLLVPGLRDREGRLSCKGAVLLPLKLLLKAVLRVMQCGCLLADRFDTARRFPLGWSVVAIK